MGYSRGQNYIAYLKETRGDCDDYDDYFYSFRLEPYQ